MRSGVTLGRTVAPLRVDGGHHRVALHELARFDVDTVCPQGFGDLLHVVHRGLGRRRRARAGDRALVCDLSAGLRVEGAAIENQLDTVGFMRPVADDRYPLAVDEDAENSCLGSQFVESSELGGAGVDEFAVCRQIGVRLLAGSRVGLRALALLGHQAAEALFVHRQAGLGRHLERQLQAGSRTCRAT